MLETLGNRSSGWMVYSPSRASVHYYGGNHRGPLKSFNMKQSSENWVCTIYITRTCVMPFNPHEYKGFQTEGTQKVWKQFKGWGAFCNLLYRVSQVK